MEVFHVVTAPETIKQASVAEIYEGSDGDKTKVMYAELEKFGPVGAVAVNLFRAQKCSTRAKIYRGGRYRDAAYDRKNWSIGNLCAALERNAKPLGIEWGWKQDVDKECHNWVLYIDLPGAGQVSFHAAVAMCAKRYLSEWDGQHLSAERIIRWTLRPCLTAKGRNHIAPMSHA